jgi:stage II sporulation protein AA (anti-sigma F factor antagonist)
LTSFVQDKQLTVALNGDIDHHHAKVFMDVISRKIDEFLPKICILDFRDVSFMDSSGIAVVIHALRRIRELEGKLELQNIPPQPLKVLMAAGMDRVVEMKGRVM